MRLKKLQKVIVAALEDIKARDIEVFDVTKLTPMYDYVVIATADSGRQARALGVHVHEAVKEAGGHIIGIEGEQSGEWVLVDCGDTVVHILQPAAREHYNLEELWQPKRAPQRSENKREPQRSEKRPPQRVGTKGVDGEDGAAAAKRPRRRAATTTGAKEVKRKASRPNAAKKSATGTGAKRRRQTTSAPADE